MDQPNVERSGEPEPRPAVPSFGEIVEFSLAALERRGRVSHTALRLEFSLDDDTLAALREELVDVLAAADDDGRVLTARDGASAGAPQDQQPQDQQPQDQPEHQPQEQQPLHRPQQQRPEPPLPVDILATQSDLVTVLLCDLEQTPELDALDAGARAVVTARWHAICGEVAARHRGQVQPWVSDGVAIFFGHPAPQDGDALRAVRCGWEVLRSLPAAREVVEREFGLRFSARLGIATAAADAGADGANGFGDAPRLAGRVQTRGAPDRLTVDAATHARASEHFAFEPLGADGLQVVSGPLEADPRVRQPPTPLVGRAAERALLQALAERAADGTCSAVLIRGEAGVGKTRLIDELCEIACDGLGMTVLHCTASPYHRGSALHPLLAGLRRHWQLDGADASTRLAERAQPIGGERGVALLAGMLAVALPDGITPLPPISPRRARRESLAILAETLAAEAARGPLLVVVEDLHWADPTTIELIDTLLEGPRERALMLALSARSEVAAPASTALQRIELGRLDAAESRRLVELVAADGGLADGLATQIAARAGGSPLLAEELTRAALAAPDGGSPVAATLYGCLMARLDRDSTARSVAQLAATIGREFDVTLLQAAGAIELSALDWGIERLLEEDIVAPTGPGGYAFRHSLLQDAARSSLGKQSLRDHNLRIARALLASFPHVAAAEPERVARHLEYAGELPEAVVHWREAGEQALAQHALAEAAGHFERGLELTARTPDTDERRHAELSLRVLAGLSVATRLSWSAPAAIAHFERAEQLARNLKRTTELFDCMLQLTDYRRVSGRLEDALALARRQVAVAEKARDSELVLEAECEAGTAFMQLGRLREAFARLARAIELYDPSAHSGHARRFGRNPAAVALAHRGLALACRDDRAGARDAIAQAAAVLRAQPHPYSHGWVLCTAAAAALICGEREVVLRESAIAIRSATDEGFDGWLGQALVLHGWARVHGGEHEAGLEECRRGAALWPATGAVVLRPFLHGLLGDALTHAGELGAGVVALDEALGWSARGERWCEPELHRMRADLLFAADDRAGALRSAQTAVALARRSGAAGWERRAAMTLARVRDASPVA
ncbi:MAG: ATP-binding protein [Thermoleophilia bacterium]